MTKLSTDDMIKRLYEWAFSDENSVNVRLVKLEQSASEQKWLRRAIASAVIACTVPGTIFFVIQIFLHIKAG